MSHLFHVDSDVLIDASIGRPAAVALIRERRSDGLPVSIVSFGELLEGTVGTDESAMATSRLLDFLGSFAVLPVEIRTMERFARLRAGLRRSGQLIPDLDSIIATTAPEYDLTLLTRNARHFDRVPGLRLSVAEPAHAALDSFDALLHPS